MKNIWTKFFRATGAFKVACAGNVAITFAFCTLPIIGTVGFAVDYSHANSVKAAMQAALDSTALMLSKDAATLSNSDLQTKARAYFLALFTRPEATNIDISATYTASGGSQVVVNGSGLVPTKFLGVIGYQNITVDGSSMAKWGTSRLRVALALDNTGSMSDDGKMAALKSATKGLLTQLKNASSTSGDVYVSIIPFSKDVNVGSGNYNGNWIDWSDWDDDNGNWQTTTTCTNNGNSRRSRSRCNSTQTWVPANHNTWNGCITDRDQDYDQRATAPNPSDVNLSANIASTLFPAEQYGNCPVAMMGLNYNWTAMNTLVDSMQPDGNTNQPVGLVWAWQSLVGGGPLIAPAKQTGYDYKDIIILMSDGLNTENRWTNKTDGESDKQKKVDDRMYKTGNGTGTCANIKAAGITIYTIHVNTGGDPMSTLLQNCASDANKFWQVTSSSGLGTVFNAIGTNLTQLRVAR